MEPPQNNPSQQSKPHKEWTHDQINQLNKKYLMINENKLVINIYNFFDNSAQGTSNKEIASRYYSSQGESLISFLKSQNLPQVHPLTPIITPWYSLYKNDHLFTNDNDDDRILYLEKINLLYILFLCLSKTNYEVNEIWRINFKLWKNDFIRDKKNFIWIESIWKMIYSEEIPEENADLIWINKLDEFGDVKEMTKKVKEILKHNAYKNIKTEAIIESVPDITSVDDEDNWKRVLILLKSCEIYSKYKDDKLYMIIEQIFQDPDEAIYIEYLNILFNANDEDSKVFLDNKISLERFKEEGEQCWGEIKNKWLEYYESNWNKEKKLLDIWTAQQLKEETATTTTTTTINKELDTVHEDKNEEIL